MMDILKVIDINKNNIKSNNMKISFIIPSWHYFSDPFKLQPYWELYYTTILRSQLKDKAE